jgi:ribonuclease HI
MKKPLVVYVDASCLIRRSKKQFKVAVVFPHRKPLTYTYIDPHGNNNEAEMIACIKAVQWADNNSMLDIITDSKITENVFNYGLSRNMRHKKMKEIFEDTIAEKNLDVTVTWQRRERNRADAPSKIRKKDKFKERLNIWGYGL